MLCRVIVYSIQLKCIVYSLGVLCREALNCKNKSNDLPNETN